MDELTKSKVLFWAGLACWAVALVLSVYNAFNC